ncbi:MAG: glutathione S-transferase family protein [Rhodospirillales bacterium]
MRTLYHTWLSPACRRVRVALREKGVEFQLRAENDWERRGEFLALNPAGEVPVLTEDDQTAGGADGGAVGADASSVICGAGPICEYLEDVYPGTPLISGDARGRAEVRRLVRWFEVTFDAEVTQNLLGEKIMKRFLGLGEPSSAAIHAGCANLKHHMDYLAHLLQRREWLAGDAFGLADITAAAQISCIDYLGDVAWETRPAVKEWYVKVKCRPSFRPLLTDYIAGVPPPKHYADLDF